MGLPLQHQPLDIIVRFSTSIPDVFLRIEIPDHTSIAALKQRIRTTSQAPASTSRLRLIHSGRVLADGAALSRSLNISVTPPASHKEKSEKARGKQPIRDKSPPATRVYIHCSIGDQLTPSELATEESAAAEADTILKTPSAPSSQTLEAESNRENVSTTPAPQGFDRLVSAGFTSAEIATLRTQFLAIQAHTNTPDTMPSGPELLALEERWLDNGSQPATAGGEVESGSDSVDDTGGLDDILYGNLIGFFWPLGAMCWLMREEGVWSRRRQIAVLSGFFVNLIFGFLRILS